MKNDFSFALIFLVILLTSSCVPDRDLDQAVIQNVTQTRIVTASPSYTLSPTIAPTPTSTSTPTEIPTPTVKSTKTPYPTPTPIGGSGKIVFSGSFERNLSSFVGYVHDLSTHQSVKIFEGFDWVWTDSHCGRKIFLSRYTPNSVNLFLINSDGTELTMLYQDAIDGPPSAYCLPGSEVIYVHPNMGRRGDQDIYKYDIDEATFTPLTDTSESLFRPWNILGISNEGYLWREARMYGDYGREIGDLIWTRFDGTQITYSDVGNIVSLSPNGQYFAYIKPTETMHGDKVDQILRIINLSNNKSHDISFNELGFGDQSTFLITWMPASEQVLIFVADKTWEYIKDLSYEEATAFILISTAGEISNQYEKEELRLLYYALTRGKQSYDRKSIVFITSTSEDGHNFRRSLMLLDLNSMETIEINIDLEEPFIFLNVDWLP